MSKFRKCTRPCIYRSSTPHLNGCDYLYLMRERRACEAGDKCKRFVEGERMKDPCDQTKIARLCMDREPEADLYTRTRIYKAIGIRIKNNM